MTDITWKDIYDGVDDLADCLRSGAVECERRGQYELSSHANVAAHVLEQQAERIADLEHQLSGNKYHVGQRVTCNGNSEAVILSCDDGTYTVRLFSGPRHVGDVIVCEDEITA